MKKILITGIDGYIGYSLALHLLKQGYEVAGLDNFSRRTLVNEVGSNSLTPISIISERERYLRSFPNFIDSITNLNLCNYYSLSRFLNMIKPDTIIHLAEQPSAPYSMRNARCSIDTQRENVIGSLSLLWAMKNNCPYAHLIKLGTMGEYGTPNCDIPEGSIDHQCSAGVKDHHGEIDECPLAGLPFPKSPGSFYHLSKVHDTNNIIFACKNWGLKSTDIMQGVVFGTKINYSNNSFEELTRFDYDEYFGTVINRFCTQAIIEQSLTVYGKGNQIRGFLPLKDSIQCLQIAIDKPPEIGEYRVFNQFENTYSVNDLATMICVEASNYGIHVGIDHIANPRKEDEEHYYNPTHEKLLNLGYKPTTNIIYEINCLIHSILPYKDKVIKEVIMPRVKWNS